MEVDIQAAKIALIFMYSIHFGLVGYADRADLHRRVIESKIWRTEGRCYYQLSAESVTLLCQCRGYCATADVAGVMY